MSINTNDFKTKSEIIDRAMPRILGNNQHKGKVVVALDIGYSSVKGISPTVTYRFPSYAKKAPKNLEIISNVRPEDILFQDNQTGDIWFVGQAAEIMMDQSDIDATTDASLFSRYRYDSDVFHVLAATGVALGLYGTGSNNDVIIQTGLPATYKDRDSEKLIQALTGHYDVSIKIGNGKWMSFVFTLEKENIFVMEQPQGTLCAVAYDKEAKASSVGRDVMSNNSIILDIGFGTEDIFSTRKGYKGTHQTYTDTGMRAVFEQVIKRLENEVNAEYKIFAFQNYLETGKAPYFDPDKISMDYYDFSAILEEINKELCEKSIRRLLQDYDNLIQYKYLIVTGGTGESRLDQIKQMLSGLPQLQVLAGNMNQPELSSVYSNVLGYYLFRHLTLSKMEKN